MEVDEAPIAIPRPMSPPSPFLSVGRKSRYRFDGRGLASPPVLISSPERMGLLCMNMDIQHLFAVNEPRDKDSRSNLVSFQMASSLPRDQTSQLKEILYVASNLPPRDKHHDLEKNLTLLSCSASR